MISRPGAPCAMFPKVCFGYTAAVMRFEKGQMEALQAVHRDQLLLETDAPHLSPGGLKVNSPAYLGGVADLVARIRQEPVKAVLAAATANAIRLYQL